MKDIPLTSQEKVRLAAIYGELNPPLDSILPASHQASAREACPSTVLDAMPSCQLNSTQAVAQSDDGIETVQSQIEKKGQD